MLTVRWAINLRFRNGATRTRSSESGQLRMEEQKHLLSGNQKKQLTVTIYS